MWAQPDTTTAHIYSLFSTDLRKGAITPCCKGLVMEGTRTKRTKMTKTADWAMFIAWLVNKDALFGLEHIKISLKF
jgi:hypothetical protein